MSIGPAPGCMVFEIAALPVGLQQAEMYSAITNSRTTSDDKLIQCEAEPVLRRLVMARSAWR